MFPVLISGLIRDTPEKYWPAYEAHPYAFLT